MAKSIQRGKTIQTRVSEEEYSLVEKKADTLGLSISNYLRMVALHSTINIYVNVKEKKK